MNHQESIIKQLSMGILYSIASWWQNAPNSRLTQAKIRPTAQKLIIRIKNLRYKLQQEAFKLQADLLKQVHQNNSVRSREGENVRMNMIIEGSQKSLVYDEVIYCLDKIISEARVLQVSPSTISNECLVSICSIIFVYEPLGLKQFVNLNQFIPQPFPNIHISKIRPLLKQYLKKQSISDYQRNLFAIQFADRNNLTLEHLNEPGHNFVPNPQKSIQLTPSSQMFAITLQEMPIEQENKG